MFLSDKSSETPPLINGARDYQSWLMFPFSLRLSPVNICIAALGISRIQLAAAKGPKASRSRL